MNEIDLLLEKKEATLRRVKREIDALRFSAALLAEPSEKMRVSIAAAAPVAAGFRAIPVGVLPFARELDVKRQFLESQRPVRIETQQQRIFPESRDGIIICDACGHRNPDYLIDCENCDIPIRLRS